ncbi:MAG: lysophospholipid acyltransferase family protein [Candidatus Kapabacteria bacterium]|nr:lysophospholipid acyltransferase family protein [Candidatus Kapabacteria bacterium]
MERIIHKILFLLFILIGAISYRLNKRNRIKFGRFLGKVMMILSPKRVKITRENLKMAFPEKDNEWIELTLRKSFDNLGIVLVEVSILGKLQKEDIFDYISYENIDIYRDAMKLNKGLLLLSAHFGNWEFTGISIGLYLDKEVLIPVKTQKNPYINDLINSFRTKWGNRVVPMDKSAIQFVKQIRSGGIIGLLADQSATKDKDIFVPFFGREAATYEAPAELALKFKIPIIVGLAVRQEDGSYIVKSQNIDIDDLEYNKDGVIELTKRHVKILESVIREHPELWLWQHRRWKHYH